MHFSAILLPALVASASATNNMVPFKFPMPKRGINPPRQASASPAPSSTDASVTTTTATIDAACASAVATVNSLVTDVPAPPAEVSSFVATATNAAGGDGVFCKYDIPASLSSAYDAWTASVVSWYVASAESVVYSAASACPELASYASDLGFCTPAPTPASVTASTTATPVVTPVVTPIVSVAGNGTGSSNGTSLVTRPTLPVVSLPTSTTPVQTAGGDKSREVSLLAGLFAGILSALVVL